MLSEECVQLWGKQSIPMATNSRLGRTNRQMQPESGRVQSAAADDVHIPTDHGRAAGVITLVGCFATILATLLPAIEPAVVGVSVSSRNIPAIAIPLAVLAVISAGIAGVVLLRRPVTARIALILIALAMAQLSLAIWFGSSIVRAIEQADSHLVFISAIGTGAYLSVLGSAITLLGGVLAWTGRHSANSDIDF